MTVYWKFMAMYLDLLCMFDLHFPGFVRFCFTIIFAMYTTPETRTHNVTMQ